jgi:hypothetical protein
MTLYYILYTYVSPCCWLSCPSGRKVDLKLNKINTSREMSCFFYSAHNSSFLRQKVYLFGSFGRIVNHSVTPYMSEYADSCLRSSHVSVSEVIQ